MNKTLYDQLNVKSDIYISNVLEQSNNFATETVEMAKIIFKERELSSPDKQRLMSHLPNIKRQVFQKMKSGKHPKEVLQFMHSKGIEPKLAKEIASQALRKLKSEEPEGSKSKGGVIFGIILALFIIKTILRFLN